MDLGADYRAAVASVPAHLKIQAEKESALANWLKRHRGVPSHELYHRDGTPRSAELTGLEAEVRQAERDVAFCRALVVAAGEAYKGEPFARVAARNEAHRGHVAKVRNGAPR